MREIAARLDKQPHSDAVRVWVHPRIAMGVKSLEPWLNLQPWYEVELSGLQALAVDARRKFRGRLMKLTPVYKRALFRRPIGPQATRSLRNQQGLNTGNK